MKINQILDELKAKVICGETDKDFEGVYAGDFLSRAMSKIEYNNLWITIMANKNAIAVASLTEAAAVILAEDVILQEDALEAARANNITVLSSSLNVYSICLVLGKFEGRE